MPETGLLQTPETIPDAAQPVYGQRGSRFMFFLSATPPIFTRLLPGYTNESVVLRAPRPYDAVVPQLPSRFIKGARPSNITVDLSVAVAGVGTLTATWAGTVLLDTAIAGVGTVSPSLVRSQHLAVDVAGRATVLPSLSGGTATGDLALNAEDSTGLTLTPEASDSQTLTPESPNSLSLTPET